MRVLWKSKRRWFVVGAAGGFAIALAAGSAARAAGSESRAERPATPVASDPGALEGSDLPVVVSLRLDAAAPGARGALVLGVDIKHRLDQTADVGSVFEVLDPHNRPVQAASFTAIRRGLDVKESGTIPGDLPDGYYVVRATAVAATERGTARSSDERTFRVRAGVIAFVSRDEFNEFSGVNDSID
jgi:hypothetical protein